VYDNENRFGERNQIRWIVSTPLKSNKVQLLSWYQAGLHDTETTSCQTHSEEYCTSRWLVWAGRPGCDSQQELICFSSSRCPDRIWGRTNGY
jgi:hypothetical protein